MNASDPNPLINFESTSRRLAREIRGGKVLILSVVPAGMENVRLHGGIEYTTIIYYNNVTGAETDLVRLPSTDLETWISAYWKTLPQIYWGEEKSGSCQKCGGLTSWNNYSMRREWVCSMCGWSHQSLSGNFPPGTDFTGCKKVDKPVDQWTVWTLCPLCRGYGRYRRDEYYIDRCYHCKGLGWIDSKSRDVWCLHHYIPMSSGERVAKGLNKFGYRVNDSDWFQCCLCGKIIDDTL